MKISIVTAVWNGAKTIRDAMESVGRQRLEKVGGESRSTLDDQLSLEYIVVDGGSTDGTVDIVRRFEEGVEKRAQDQQRNCFTFKWISERDSGLYDAINKGIKMATGDVVGICNADDVLADDDVVAKVAEGFLTQRHRGEELDAIYADVRFVKELGGPTTRYCTGKFFRPWMFRFATFPAHPSTFVRKTCFEQYGYYSLDYKICADFEMMLRLFWKHRARTKYLPLCTHVMRTGGMSTNGLKSNVQINYEDLRAIKANGYWSCLPLIYTKYFFKVWGLLRKK